MARSSNKGIIAVVGIGCALGLFLALGYLLYWMPKQKAEEARKEIDEYSLAWVKAKTCLLGKAPASQSPEQALSARALTIPDLHAKLGACVNTLRALRRGEGYSTENDSIEEAWQKIQIPVSKLAQAQAWFSAKEPNNPPEVLRAKLASAITQVDVAERALRKAGGLALRSESAPTLPAASVERSLLGPDKTPATISNVRVEADAITYRARTEDSEYRVSIGPEEERFARLSPLALRAIDASWGMWLEDDGIPMPAHQARAGAMLMAGRLDAFGEPSGEGVLLHTLANGEYLDPKFAIGEDRRTLLFRIDEVAQDYQSGSFRYVLMGSDDGGQSFANVPLPAGQLWVSLKESALGNHLSWEKSPDTTSLNFLELNAQGASQRLLNFAGKREGLRYWPPELCQAPKRAWWIVDGAVYTMASDGRLLPIPGQVNQDPQAFQQTMRCTDEAFSVSSQRYGESAGTELFYQSCTLERCGEAVHKILLPEGARYQLVHHEGTWQALVMLDELVARWSEGASGQPTQLVSTSKAKDVYGALSWPSGLFLLAWPEEAANPSLIRLP